MIPRDRSPHSLLGAVVRFSALSGTLFVLAAAALVGDASPRVADADGAVLSPVGFLIVDEPVPVLGTDRRNHLAYELLLTNQSSLDVTVVSIQAVSNGRPIGAAVSGDDVPAVLRINGGVDGATIPAGGSATFFADVTYPQDARRPRRLLHRIELVGSPADDPATRQTFSFTGVPTKVSNRVAVEVEPPLRGDGWVVGNGCCSPPNAHRGATLSIDGTVYVPERFAIDFVQIDRQNRLFTGPGDRNESYPYFGDEIYSATAGTVVRVQDGLPEQTPGTLPEGQTVQTAGGNYVVVDMGRGRYAFYAHMQPGSLRVKRGDRVKPGDVLGLLGNTGNTDAAHLHFHVMDSPSPLQANGLPFTFRRMTGLGQITDPATLATGAPVTIDAAAFSGLRHGQMPMADQVVGFP